MTVAGRGASVLMPSINVVAVLVFAITSEGTHWEFGLLVRLHTIVSDVGPVYPERPYVIDGSAGVIGAIPLWGWALH